MIRVLSGYLAMMLAVGFPAGASPTGSTSESSTIASSTYIAGPFSPRWLSPWPSVAGRLKTAKIQAAVIPAGLRTGFQGAVPAFGSNTAVRVNLLDEVSLWVGGIRAGDTLVSTQDSWRTFSELFVPEAPLTARGVYPEAIDIGAMCRATVVDTFTAAHLPGYWQFGNDPYHGTHIPLGVSVLLRAYVWDYGIHKNVLLLDYTIQNVSGETLDDVVVTAAVIPDIFNLDAYTIAWADELLASPRDREFLMAWDNDGNAVGGRFTPDASAIDGVGLLPALTSPPAEDTNFNWSANDQYYDYDSAWAPRQRGRMDDPFRPYYTNPSTGCTMYVPVADRDRYYQMRHDEWDYDLARIAQIGAADSIWLPPDPVWRNALRRGGTVTGELSVGTWDLAPDSAVRVVFGLFYADAVLTEPNTGAYLVAGDIDEYYRRLNLEAFTAQAEAARSMAGEMLDRRHPPTGLHILDYSGDSVVLAWDRRVFPDIDGCLIRLTPVPQGDFIVPGFVRPGAVPTGPGVEYAVAGDNPNITITGLLPGRFYFAEAAHRYQGQSGTYSTPVIVGYRNRSLTPRAPQPEREFAFIHPGDEGITLHWTPGDEERTAYYKVYRVDDSAAAADRYEPFFAVDSLLTPIEPLACGDADGPQWCFYRMPAIDSVPVGQNSYVDRELTPAAWYWITAVSRYGYESPFSRPVQAQLSREPDRDILVVLGSTVSFHDYVVRDSLYAYYRRVLEGLEFDLYDWADTNSNVHSDQLGYRVNWDDLARYRLIIVEDLPATAILTAFAEGRFKTVQRLLASGRDVLYFGAPTEEIPFNLSLTANTIAYDSLSVPARYFGLDSLLARPWMTWYGTIYAPDTLAGFCAAVPANDSLPLLVVDTANCRTTDAINRLFATGRCLPMTPAFCPTDSAEILYRYRSAFPSSSHLEGLPCGVRMKLPGANAYAFSFHLWGMEESNARALIEYALRHQEPDTAFEPHILPEGFRLHQNFPNPFNPATTIPFDLLRPGRVRLQIFNMLGQEVTTLVDAYRSAGIYDVSWDGRDRRGRLVASGIYLYRLQTPDGSAVRKMALVK